MPSDLIVSSVSVALPSGTCVWPWCVRVMLAGVDISDAHLCVVYKASLFMSLVIVIDIM